MSSVYFTVSKTLIRDISISSRKELSRATPENLAGMQGPRTFGGRGTGAGIVGMERSELQWKQDPKTSQRRYATDHVLLVWAACYAPCSM